MEPPVPEKCRISIVVVPRERFSCAQASLESLLDHTQQPFDLIYVDGGSPPYVRDYLRKMAAGHGFTLIRREEFLSPNHARNLALPLIQGDYVVFVDNDVQVTPGWLAAMVECAEETRAGVITPLILVGELSEQTIHSAGGDMVLEERDGQRLLRESHRHWNGSLSDARRQFKREPCDYAEFHCMLTRPEVLAAVGEFDEEMLAVSEHLDFSLRVKQAGYTTWFEPGACVTYLATRLAALSDLPYFNLRWSPDWTGRSARRLMQNWQLGEQSEAVSGAINFGNSHRVHLRVPAAHAEGEKDALAQTHLQLYDQCQGHGCSADELALLKRTYDQARIWFNGMYRACGRPFVAHLTGTASILAACGAPTELVAAGLVHSAYLFGNLGIPGQGITPDKRRMVSTALSPEVELWVYFYAAFDWKGADTVVLLNDIDQMSLLAAKSILLRLANDLEEYESRSLAYSSKAKPDAARWLPLYLAVAEKFMLPGLVQRLKTHWGAGDDTASPPALRSTEQRSMSLKG